MKQSRVGKNALAIALLGALCTGNALAQSLDASETTAVINQENHNASVVFTNTSPATVGAFDFSMSYNAGNLTIATADITTDHAGTSCSVPAAGTILCFSNPTVGLTLPDTVTITMPFDVGATEQVEPLTFGAVNMFDSGGGGVTPTLDDGQITVQAAPPDANLVFDPASGGTVTFPGGTQNDTVTASIDVTATGTNGSGTVSNCSFSGGAFSVTSSLPISVAVGGSDSIDLECVLDDVAQSATLTCDTNDVDGAGTASWTMSCPAGTAVPSPDFTSTPPAGSTITCNGSPGAVVNRTIVIENTGNPGTGSELDYTCTIAGTGFAFVSGQTGTGIAVGGSSELVFSCTVPADGTNTGTIDCTSNGGAASYDLSAGVVTAPPPVAQPAIIPANSLWSLLALFGVMAGIGAVVVGLRRH